MVSDPTVLAFDTSAAHCAAALLSGGQILATRQEDMARGQAERLMPLLQEMLAEAGVALADLDAIGVGVGPGNFTGIRISVSAARGLALSLGVPAIGVSLLEAAAYGTDGPVLASLNAPRDRLYLQRFHPDTPRGPALVEDAEVPDWALPGMTCIGQDSAALGQRLGLPHVDPRCAPVTAIARIAASRLGTPQPRPAPLYLRKADAAPPADPPPRILT